MARPRSTQARGRSRKGHAALQDQYAGAPPDELAHDSDDEPPTKRLRTSRHKQSSTRWIPGGRGGGGRRIDVTDQDTVPTTPRAVDEYPAPRTRRRDTVRRPAANRTYSARRSHRGAGRPRYSTAAAAAAATHNDGYKPREERGWEEYHPDLELDSAFAVISSEEVDGVAKNQDATQEPENKGVPVEVVESKAPIKRRPGRPHRTQSSMLQSLWMPETPKVVPMPGPNPSERLTLPKPSYRVWDPFTSYEQKEVAMANFVNQAMANVGYQEGDLYIRPPRTLIRQMEGSADEDLDLMPDLMASGGNSAIGGSGVGRVEYDMDEQDVKWLEAMNKTRVLEGVAPIKPAIFEITMTKVEKEWHALEKRIPKPNPKAPQTQRPRSSSAAAVNGEPLPGEEPDSKCAICDDGDCENANAIVFCDGCDLAVHQECYGVPYIPEGQWLCRKCQLVGSARPSCIFCPNEGGAFKQTNNSKWAHLLCATWIPEVTIGNPSLMEPVTDVEKVPNSRWKLGCYICKQDMGASIQCSDGRCYEPFHLTCARQAGLYLRMKTGGGQNTLMDASHLRAYCHKHTPTPWRLEHDTDKLFDRAGKHFQHHFQGQVWADSKASALAIGDPHDSQDPEKGPQRLTLTNKRGQKPKAVWRLPSGAPVIPEAILKSIEESLMRFSVPKKKEYVAEICKYWTLKREARRGAALLKRLQLQMDTFSSFEVTRRDYRSQGAAGRARLERRIEFAETLLRDLERITRVCQSIKAREAEKLQDAHVLREIVDTVYFPLPALLGPVIERAIKLDPKGVYGQPLAEIRDHVRRRSYEKTGTFLADFTHIFNDDLGFDASDQSNLQALYARPETRLEDEVHRERRTLARRIMKAVYPGIQDALDKESELTGRPFAQQMKEIESFSNRPSTVVEAVARRAHSAAVPLDADHDPSKHVRDIPVQSIESEPVGAGAMSPRDGHGATRGLPAFTVKPSRVTGGPPVNSPPVSTNGIIKQENASTTESGQNEAPATEPLTPPMSTQGHSQKGIGHGGVPWYVQQFDPEGTTVYEERWTGADVLRELSEELTDMDEDELEDLRATTLEEERLAAGVTTDGKGRSAANSEISGTVTKPARKSKRRSNTWADRAFRNRRQR